MERINKPSLEFLLGLKHGQKVNVSIEGTECEAIVNANEFFMSSKSIHFCQNLKNGNFCADKMGKKYSWCVSDSYDLEDIKWIELVEDCLNVVPEIKVYDSYDSYETSVTIPTEETIDFDEYDLLAIEFIKLAMKK